MVKQLCKNCGAIFFDKKQSTCPVCNIPLMEVSFFTGRKIDNLGGESRNKYIEEIIGHKLDPVLVQKQKEYFKKSYEESKEILQKRIRKSEESRINEYQQKYLAEHNIHCPYCNSSNVTKIGIVNR
ncbi:MAG TPA: hypothetical protein DCW90_15915, partial [Lachnospiraceae bacterium]|nr:hypothetical protein [Lachnospiraceae bacterium]